MGKIEGWGNELLLILLGEHIFRPSGLKIATCRNLS